MIHIIYAILIGLGCMVLGAFIGGMIVEHGWQKHPKMTITGSVNPRQNGEYVKVYDVPAEHYTYEGEIKKL